MSLQLPNLDDRSYEDLVEEALALIPTHAPQWTNHNPSDPGITLVELFAFLTEAIIYRLNRVTSRNILSFLKLLNGTNWDPFSDDPGDMDERELSPIEKASVAARLNGLSDDDLRGLVARQVPITIRRLRKLQHAVSRQDFETLALESNAGVARAYCQPRKNLEMDLEGEREGHVSVIVLVDSSVKAEDVQGVMSDVTNHITPRLLVTTRLHVVEVSIKTSVALRADQKEEGIEDKIVEAIEDFFDPLPAASRNRQGWPFGRNVFTSEIFALLDQAPFIDYVTSVELAANFPGRELPGKAGIEVKPFELVKVGEVLVQIVNGA
jgi:Baseplate J-like protein